MRITISHSTGATRTDLMRGLDDDRRLIISAPWGQPHSQTIAAIWNQLTPEEQREVALAFGLDPIPPEEAV